MNLIQEILQRVKTLEAKMWGAYKGQVTAVDDPEGLGRIKAKVKGVIGEDFETNWAAPKSAFGGDDAGLWMPPEVGDDVWMEFQHGDKNAPLWVGYYWPLEAKPPSEATVNKRMFKSKAGHYIIFDDDAKEIKVLSVGDMDITVEGNAELLVKGNVSGTIEGNSELTVKGNASGVIEGMASLLVKQNAALSCEADVEVAIEGNLTGEVEGNVAAKVMGNANLEADGDVVVKGKTIKMNKADGEVVTDKTHPVCYYTGARIKGVPEIKGG